GQRIDLRRHQVVGSLCGLGDVDLLCAVGGQRGVDLASDPGRADHHGGRLAERPRRCEQLERGLVDLTILLVDKDQNLRHALSPVSNGTFCWLVIRARQSSFWPTRYSATLVPPSPSSLTRSPA